MYNIVPIYKLKLFQLVAFELFDLQSVIIDLQAISNGGNDDLKIIVIISINLLQFYSL